jgi:hypothetical protein
VSATQFEPLAAPFPWFGGKSRVAPLVWERFGDVANYVEPFFGSGAVLLGRPTEPKTETVNDKDAYLANFWRALRAEPDAVAAWAADPVHEADLIARHVWLVEQAAFRERMRDDAHFYDVKIAGWWVWGQCAWIGSGWCAHARVPDQLPHLGDAGMGIHRPAQKLPHLGDAGRGVHRPAQRLPHLGNAGMGEVLRGYLAALSDRLARVRVACGEWDRVLGDSVTWRHGVTGIFLDPPYGDDEHSVAYASSQASVTAEVGRWALANGDNPLLRIALCGYAGEHEMPGWDCVPWKARGGYGSQAETGRGRDNARRERVWFSPHCTAAHQGALAL